MDEALGRKSERAMTTQRLAASFSPAAIASTGEFSGYGAVFGNLDSHSDIIQPGAFRASLAAWRARGRWPRMLLMHGSNGNAFTGSDIPVGVWTDMREDAKGLWVEGRILALETDYGRRILSLMKGGALDGLSIGYRVKRHTAMRTGGRMLDEIDLREVSIVDEPSNDLARITAVKQPAPQAALDEAADKLRAALGGLAGTMSAPSADAAYERMRAALQGL